MYDDEIGKDTENIFRTSEGWGEFRRRMARLHNRATPGQTEGIIKEVQQWENERLVGLEQEEEYHDIMRAQEIFERLTKREDQ